MNKTEKSMKVKLRLIFHMERDLLKVESKVLILELLHYPYTTQVLKTVLCYIQLHFFSTNQISFLPLLPFLSQTDQYMM
ncbi:hypothetical protein SLEP1_g43031 [Rubroshorea leprosula]|uniref:Uncharacterized protein n=1 Tax=Rubroshorea leprosula TaxID=152421 RepID=A0AAV5LD80_9ROSI|nr:hypothetical protein SLEP1_g43031 [Rubroshorea leprosula]